MMRGGYVEAFFVVVHVIGAGFDAGVSHDDRHIGIKGSQFVAKQGIAVVGHLGVRPRSCHVNVTGPAYGNPPYDR